MALALHDAPPLLGRTRELSTLSTLLGLTADAARIDGQAVLLGGDAGVGKTRVLAELSERAHAAGWRVLTGHCLDFADSLLPYLPFSEMVGRLADEEPETARALVEERPALAALTPGRRLMAGSSAGSSAGAPADDVDRAEIFEGVHAAFGTLAAERPLLLVVEDLHWADQSTRDLLGFLFGRPHRDPVAVLGSYRSEDLHRRHPLRTALAQWSRLPGIHRIQLDRLPDPDMRRLVRALHRGPLREREVAGIVARAEGNAFFAEELVAAHALPPAVLPEDLADLLLVRVDRLEVGARDVVRAASVAGRRVGHDLLAAVVRLPAAELEQALRTAVDQNVLVRVEEDAYAFRHALLAEAVYGDLLPGEKVRLHAAYAGALASGEVPGAAAELATHARAAHDVPTAIRASVRAGDEAMAVGGPEDAASHFEAALELASRPGQPLPEGVALADLVQRTSEAVIASGHPARAMALVGDFLAQAPADLPAEDRARLLIAWAGASLMNENIPFPLEAAQEALSLAGEEPSRLRAQALTMLARCRLRESHLDEAARFASEGLAIAQRLGMARTEGEATTVIATVDGLAGETETALRALTGVVVAARERGDTQAQMRGCFHLGHMYLERADLAEAQQAFAEGADAAASMGQPWVPYGFDARLMQALTAYLRGRFDEALDLAAVTGQSPPADPEALLATVRMLVAVARGEGGVLDSYEQLRSTWERESLVAINSGAAAIEDHGRRGDLAAVWAVHDDVVASVSRTWVPSFQARVRLSALVVGQLCAAAVGATHAEQSGLLHRLDELEEAVAQVMSRVDTLRHATGPETRAWVARMHAEVLRLRWLTGVDAPVEADLVAAWREALAAFEAFGNVYEIARTQVRLAAVLRSGGRSAEVDELLFRARGVATELRAAPLLAEAARTSTPARGGVARAARSAPPTALTAREAEILALVAAGRTNGEIGRQLFISTKTVSVHVSNILAKLGASGRTEAAAIARRDGLLL